jgi:uncharacterized protein YodC (DUF2158 family)
MLIDFLNVTLMMIVTAVRKLGIHICHWQEGKMTPKTS